MGRVTTNKGTTTTNKGIINKGTINKGITKKGTINRAIMNNRGTTQTTVYMWTYSVKPAGAEPTSAKHVGNGEWTESGRTGA